MLKLLLSLWGHISSRRRSQFSLLLVLMILTSFAEIISIGSVLPFLAILTNPVIVFSHPYAYPFIELLDLTEPSQLLLPIVIAFSLATIGAGSMRLLLLWASTRLGYAVGGEISKDIYRKTLYQPYPVHINRNSSELINGISNKIDKTIYIINSILNLISSVFIMVGVIIAFLYVDSIIALYTFCGFGSIYAFIIILTRKRLKKNGQIIARESTLVIKLIQEGLGGIRDILINGNQAFYCENYQKSDLSLRQAQGNSSYITYAPRYAIECLGMLFIAFLSYKITQQSDGLSKAIPILGSLAVGAQRLLPILQQTYGSWTSIQGGRALLEDTLHLLDQPLPSYITKPEPQVLRFTEQIRLNRIYFRYSSERHWVIKGLDLVIPKGSRVGFIGVTGSGKSTLLDIVMGLLQPTNGTITVDDQILTSGNSRAWQAHIAHVPQVIFLADSSIEENIAFGVPKALIDGKRVREVALQAQIADAIESWPKKYNTLVGERGIHLSGGQRQRIGIARALYKQADVIIFDEATSALDNETEHSVMQSIEGLSKEITLLLIAHRLTSLSSCTHIVELCNGAVSRIGNYQDLVENNLNSHNSIK
jgi:ABC-type multidrug transport system fused ATPase/permease subunit